MSQRIIEAKSVEKIVATSEGELVILDGVDLEINAGESVAIVGASGSGKTTLLGILAGLDLPTGGSVILVGNEITSLDEEARARIRGEQVGFVFQTFQLLGSLTALENVMLPAELHGENDAEDEARTLLDKVGLARASATIRGSCPAANSSGWPSRALSLRDPTCCLRMSRRAIWIP